MKNKTKYCLFTGLLFLAVCFSLNSFSQNEKWESNEEYSTNINKALEALKYNDYEEAKLYLEKSLEIRPNSKFALKKLDYTNNQLYQIKNKSKGYKNAIKWGEEALKVKDYKLSRQYFAEALAIEPQMKHLQEKLEKLDTIISRLELIQKKYDDAILNADQMMEQNDLQSALIFYKKALIVKPENEYAKAKIKEIKYKNEIIDIKYSKAIFSGDLALKQKNYKQAQEFYMEAKNIRPDSKYPDKKIDEIKQFKIQYEQYIYKGDNAFKKKNYHDAIKHYNDAQNLFPNDDYTKGKLKEIEKIIASLIVKFKQNIDSGDVAFNKQKFLDATLFYLDAIAIVPDAKHPRMMIDSINENHGSKKNESQLAKIIKAGDLYFNSQRYLEAKKYYADALMVNPYDKYSYNQITNIRAGIEQHKTKEEELAKKADNLLPKKKLLTLEIENFVVTETESIIRLIFKEINKGRTKKGVKLLTINEILNKSAYHIAEKNATYEEIFLTDYDDPKTTSDRIEHYGGYFKAKEYLFTVDIKKKRKVLNYEKAIEEIIATIKKNSSMYKATINKRYKYIGIGLSPDEYNKKLYFSIVLGY